jgi:hypothetical protein
MAESANIVVGSIALEKSITNAMISFQLEELDERMKRVEEKVDKLIDLLHKTYEMITEMYVSQGGVL